MILIKDKNLQQEQTKPRVALSSESVSLSDIEESPILLALHKYIQEDKFNDIKKK